MCTLVLFVSSHYLYIIYMYITYTVYIYIYMYVMSKFLWFHPRISAGKRSNSGSQVNWDKYQYTELWTSRMCISVTRTKYNTFFNGQVFFVYFLNPTYLFNRALVSKTKASALVKRCIKSPEKRFDGRTCWTNWIIDDLISYHESLMWL